MGAKCLSFTYIISILVVVLSTLLIINSNKVIRALLKPNLQLTPNTELYKNWLNIPVPIYMKFYMFNLTNSDDFAKNISKPKFQEVGPFVYKEVRLKENVVDNLNYTLSYRERRLFSFVPELSVSGDDVPVTTINMAVVAIVYYVHYWPDLEKRIVNLALDVTGEKLFVTRTVRELLFGYEDPFLVFLNKLDKNLVPETRLSLFYDKNNTYEGLFTIYTGVNDIDLVGTIERYNGQKTLSTWTSPYANMINGTDATLTKPFLKTTDSPYTFQSDVCRSFKLTYNDTYKLYNSIDTYGYALDEFFFENATVNPENAGFCTPKGNCLPKGLFNISECVKMGDKIDIPVVFSSPHFMFTDPRVQDAVIGLKPNYTEHKCIVYFEPTTGVPMIAHKRIQFNTKLLSDSKITATSNLQQIYFPIFWLDEYATLDVEHAKIFERTVKLPLQILNTGKYILLALGSFALAMSVIVTLSNIRNARGRNNTELAPPSDETTAINWDAEDEREPLLRS